jgi:hypothetical protein
MSGNVGSGADSSGANLLFFVVFYGIHSSSASNRFFLIQTRFPPVRMTFMGDLVYSITLVS